MAMNRIILAKWMALPIGWHHDPLEVWMIAERDTEQIEHLAFIPVRTSPDLAK